MPVTGSLQKKGNRWYAVLNLTDPATGRRRMKWVGTGHSRKRDAEVVFADILSKYNDGSFVEPSKITLKELLDRWFTDVAKFSLSESMQTRYECIVYKHLIPNLGGYKLQKLSPAMIQRYYREAIESGRLGPDGDPTGESLSSSTVRKHHNVLRRALGQAVQWQLIQRNPCDAVHPPKESNDDIEFWSPDETRKFLSVASEVDNFPLYALALATGLRRGELFGLCWDAIDLQENSITVRRVLAKPTTPPTFGPPKTKASRRTVTLSRDILKLLRKHKARQNEDRLRMGPRYEDYNLVFAQPNGRPLHPNNLVRREFVRLQKQTEVPLIKFHALRHTHVTDLIRRGIHVKTISLRIGHSSIRVTMDRYGHLLPEMQSDAAGAIDDLLPKTGDEKC